MDMAFDRKSLIEGRKSFLVLPTSVTKYSTILKNSFFLLKYWLEKVLSSFFYWIRAVFASLITQFKFIRKQRSPKLWRWPLDPRKPHGTCVGPKGEFPRSELQLYIVIATVFKTHNLNYDLIANKFLTDSWKNIIYIIFFNTSFCIFFYKKVQVPGMWQLTFLANFPFKQAVGSPATRAELGRERAPSLRLASGQILRPIREQLGRFVARRCCCIIAVRTGDRRRQVLARPPGHKARRAPKVPRQRQR